MEYLIGEGFLLRDTAEIVKEDEELRRRRLSGPRRVTGRDRQGPVRRRKGEQSCTE